MLVFLNGRLVPEEQAVVSVFDRSFLYGDGLFETMLVANGKVFRWAQHFERLQRGAAFLKIKLPYSADELHSFAYELIEKNQIPDALLRLTLSRGVGVRGYSPKGAENPTVVMSLHAAPQAGLGVTSKVGTDLNERMSPRWKLVTASVRLPANERLAQFKTCNKLAQILARAEADAGGADEALLLNTDGFIVEGASSNLFWIERGTVCTPPLASGILAGVTRAVVREICRKLGLKFTEACIAPDKLKTKEGVFLSLSSWGIVEARALDAKPLKRSPVVRDLCRAYQDIVLNETAGRRLTVLSQRDNSAEKKSARLNR